MVDLLHLAILLLSKCELSDQNLLDLLSRAEAETLPEMLLLLIMQFGLKKVHVCGICMHFFTNLPSHRGRKVLQDLNNQNDERITTLEDSLKTT